MPFESVNVESIENRTYYVELNEKMNSLIFNYLEVYGNILMDKESNNKMKIIINQYDRKPTNYNENGEIITYTYNIGVDFIVNNKKTSVYINKNYDANIEQNFAQDSIIIESIKKYTDLIREDF